MKRGRLARRTPLRREAALTRRTPLGRTPPLRPAQRSPSPRAAGPARWPLSASDAQRAKIVGAWCIVCQQTKGLTPAHLASRAHGGCDHPHCVVPLCWLHHRAFDTGRLELLPYLEPLWRAEIAHAVSHLGLIGTLRRLTRAPA